MTKVDNFNIAVNSKTAKDQRNISRKQDVREDFNLGYKEISVGISDGAYHYDRINLTKAKHSYD